MRHGFSRAFPLALVMLLAAPAAWAQRGGDPLRAEITAELPAVDRELRALLGDYDVAGCAWLLSRAAALGAQPRAPYYVDDMRRLQAALLERVRKIDPCWQPPAEPEAEPPPLLLRRYSLLPLLRAPDRPEPPPVIERGHHGNRGISEDVPHLILSAEELVEMLREDLSVMGRSRHEEVEDCIEAIPGSLAVHLPEAEQELVEAGIDRLARLANFHVRVAVDLVRLDAAALVLLQERGLRGQLLSEEAEAEFRKLREAEGQAALLASGEVRLAWGQRGLIRQGETRTYVADHEIEQTNSVLPVITSIVGAMNLGFSCGLSVHRAGREGEVLIDATAVFAALPGEIRQQKTEGGQLQLPEVDQMQLSTTLRAPLGRTVLLGGWFPGDVDAPPAGGIACFARVTAVGK